jgi:hypothetical protein
MSPVTLSSVLKISGIDSIASRTMTPSTGTPAAKNAGNVLRPGPLCGIPGAVKLIMTTVARNRMRVVGLSGTP